MRTGHFALAMLLALGIGPITAPAQGNSQNGAQAPTQPADSLAAAARRAREERKDKPTAAKVYTNDNLPTNSTISFVGEAPSPAAAAKDSKAQGADAAKVSTDGQNAAKTAETKDKRSELEAQLAAAKEQLQSAKTDLDIAQRKFALDQQTYLTDPNHSSDKATADQLQTEQDAISAKQDEVAAAQKVVQDLEARLAAADAAPAPDSGNSKSADTHP